MFNRVQDAPRRTSRRASSHAVKAVFETLQGSTFIKVRDRNFVNRAPASACSTASRAERLDSRCTLLSWAAATLFDAVRLALDSIQPIVAPCYVPRSRVSPSSHTPKTRFVSICTPRCASRQACMRLACFRLEMLCGLRQVAAWKSCNDS
eukprot:4171905-Pleurochrysis_carterae.AAC.1